MMEMDKDTGGCASDENEWKQYSHNPEAQVLQDHSVGSTDSH